jgi:Rap1a immunity proteins
MKAIVIGALIALTVTAANAAEQDTNSANYMLPGCRISAGLVAFTAANAYIAGLCLGSVLGIADMLSFPPSCSICIKIPEGVTQGQIVMVVLKYIEAQPQSMQERFTRLAAQALLRTWLKVEEPRPLAYQRTKIFQRRKFP